MAKVTKASYERKKKELASSSWYEGHKKYLENTKSFRQYGGTPDSQGKVYDLKGKGKELARKINSPKAKEKRSLRHDAYEGHANRFTVHRLAELNRK